MNEELNAVVAERYKLIKCLGRGGMSEVFLARDLILDKEWAVKIISREGVLNGKICVMSALAEINILKKLDHPSLPRIVDIIENDKELYVIMDYISGITLGEYIKKYDTAKEKVIVEWAKQLCEVLIYLHSREPAIIYRDMKPENIMLTDEGKIKLIDFGIAREYKRANEKDTVYLGTKGYAAPEQFGGNGQTDERTDIYCLGVTLYHLLTGKDPSKPPYKIYPIRYWNKSLSVPLEKIILKSTRENPKERYQSVSLMLSDLENIKRDSNKYLFLQKCKIYVFRGTLFIAVTLMVLSYAIKELYDTKNDQYFETYINMIKESNDIDRKNDFIKEAMNIKPGSLRLWELMVENYKADGAFTTKEEKELLTYYDVSMSYENEDNEMIKQKGRVEYDIAGLYWYYYKYDEENVLEKEDDTLSGVIPSIAWFEKAISNGAGSEEKLQRAHIMLDMGTFYKNITLMEKESNDDGLYRKYVENISNMLAYLKNEKNITLKIKFIYTSLSGVDTYLINIKKDKVERREILKICRETDDIIRNIDEKECSDDEYDMYLKTKKIIYEIETKIPEVF